MRAAKDQNGGVAAEAEGQLEGSKKRKRESDATQETPNGLTEVDKRRKIFTTAHKPTLPKEALGIRKEKGKRGKRDSKTLESGTSKEVSQLKDDFAAEGTPQPEVESEASKALRLGQLQILHAVRAKDPNYDRRQMGVRVKDAPLDRKLIYEAYEVGENKLKSWYVYPKGIRILIPGWYLDAV